LFLPFSAVSPCLSLRSLRLKAFTPVSNPQIEPAQPHRLECLLIFFRRENGRMRLNGISLTWLGHATFRIQTPKGKIIIIDPWVMGNPACPEEEKDGKAVDILLCTHGHGDHIGDAVEIAEKHNPKVVGIPELCGWLKKKGVKQLAEM